jgi:hypothetical protein
MRRKGVSHERREDVPDRRGRRARARRRAVRARRRPRALESGRAPGNGHHLDGDAEANPSGEGTSGEGTGGESSEETTGAGESNGATSESHAGSDATLLGIDLEGTPFVIVALAASIALAIALVVLRLRALLVVTIVIALAFAIADVREVFHQLHERPGIAALGTVVALAHVVAAAAAAWGARLTRPELSVS